MGCSSTYTRNNIEQFRALEDATEWKLDPALFHKTVKKFGNPGKISLLSELTLKDPLYCIEIKIELDFYFPLLCGASKGFSLCPETRNNGYQCFPSYLEWLSMPSFLWSTFQSCRLNISDDLLRQDKCSSCTTFVNPY